MKAEKVYETFEAPNDKKLGWKIAGGIAFSFVAVICLIILVASFADIVDWAGDYFSRFTIKLARFAFDRPVIVAFWLAWLIVLVIYKKVRR